MRKLLKKEEQHTPQQLEERIGEENKTEEDRFRIFMLPENI